MFKFPKIKLLFVVFLPLLFLIVSCTDFDPVDDLNGTRADIRSMLRSEDITQRASIDANNFTFVSKMGTIVSAEPNSFVFVDGGTLATGMIDFEMTELFTKSEILQYGIVTESNNSILESDGEFLFRASQNGQPLRLVYGKGLRLKVPNPDPNPGMELFFAGEGAWWPSQDTLNTILTGNPSSFNGYEFFVNRLDWVNIDYFTKFDLDLTDIKICLPEGYQDDIISVWIVFRDIDVVLGSSGENLPIGEAISIVCIAAEDESTFRMDIQNVTVKEGLKVNLDPKEESIENIKKLLKELD